MLGAATQYCRGGGATSRAFTAPFYNFPSEGSDLSEELSAAPGRRFCKKGRVRNEGRVVGLGLLVSLVLS